MRTAHRVPPFPHSNAPEAALMLRLVKGLGVRHGRERSFKMREGELIENRFLLSVHRKSLGSDPADRLSEICRTIRIPGVYWEDVEAKLPEADFVHFGFEQGARSVTCKLYLEFAAQFRRAMRGRRHSGGPRLVHLGYKWDPREPRRRAVARYLGWPPLGVAGIAEKLSEVFAHRRSGLAYALARQLAETASGRMPEEDILLMEVEESDNPRRSFDMNVYDAELRLKDLAPSLPQLWAHFRIPEEQSARLAEGVEHRILGHLSGGADRDGKEFLSVHFGVEAR